MSYDYLFPSKSEMRLEVPSWRHQGMARLADRVFEGRKVKKLDIKASEWLRSFPTLSVKCPDLQELILDGIGIGYQQLFQLADDLSAKSRLTRISLQDNGLKGVEGANAVGKLLLASYPLKDLNLSGNRLGTRGVLQLLKYLKFNSSLENLGVRRNYAHLEEIQAAFEELIEINGTLETVDLGEGRELMAPGRLDFDFDSFNIELLDPPSNKKALDFAIQSCLEEFPEFNSNLRDDVAQIGRWVEQLAGETLPEEPLKQLGQALGLGGVPRKGEQLIKFDGWQAQKHLLSQMAFFFFLLLKIAKEVNPKAPEKRTGIGIHPAPVDPFETFHKIKEELLVLMISYGAARQLKEKLLDQLSGRVDKLVRTIKEGKELSFPGGYKGHCMYLSFYRTKKGLIARIDNHGPGCKEPYHKPVSGSEEYLPFILGRINERKSLKGFVQEIFSAKFQPQKPALKTIYTSPKKFSKLLSGYKIYAHLPSGPLQGSGNCVDDSQAIGKRHRLGEELFHWIRSLKYAYFCSLYNSLEGQETEHARDFVTISKALFKDVTKIPYVKKLLDNLHLQPLFEQVMDATEQQQKTVEDFLAVQDPVKQVKIQKYIKTLK